MQEIRFKTIPFFYLLILLNSAANGHAGISFFLASLLVLYIGFFHSMEWSASRICLGIFIFALFFQVLGIQGWFLHDPYLAAKDSWYFINCFLYIFLGVLLINSREICSSFLFALFCSGLLCSFMQLSNFIINPQLLGLSAIAIRDEIGFGYYDVVISFFLGFLYCRFYPNGPFRKFAIFGVILSFCAIVLSFSRALSLSAILAIIICFGMLRRRALLKILIFSVIAIFFISFLRVVIDLNDPASYETFLGKIAHIIDEGEISGDMTFEEINTRWRGYETSQAYAQFERASIFDRIFGQGFGQQIDVGIYIALGADEYDLVRFIDILHNGYFYVLTKVGLVGLTAFLMAILMMFYWSIKFGAAVNLRDPPFGDMMLFAILSISLATWSTGGFFNKDANVGGLLLLGFSFVNAVCFYRTRSGL